MAAMRRVERIQLHVTGDAAGAADTGHQSKRLQINLRFNQRPRETIHRAPDTAAWTPDVRHALGAQEGFDRVGDVEDVHRLASRIAFRMSSGRCTLPPACGTGSVFALPPAARSTSRTICPRLS